jgi:hypothetical protein
VPLAGSQRVGDQKVKGYITEEFYAGEVQANKNPSKIIYWGIKGVWLL